MNFQAKLLYVRAKLNLSQTELAKELGVFFLLLTDEKMER